MNLKTFSGSSMGEALAQVKKDLGKDAVILHTRTYRVGGVLGVGGRQMVEITASDHPSTSGPTIRPARRPADPAPSTPSADGFTPTRFEHASIIARGTSAYTPRPAAPTTPAASASPAAPASPVTPASPASPVTPVTPAAQPASRRASDLAVRVELAPTDDAAAVTLKDELNSIRRLVAQVLEVARRPSTDAAPILAVGGLSDPILAIDQRLLDQGLDPTLRDQVISALRRALASTITQPNTPALAQLACEALAKLIPCDPATDHQPRTTSARVEALIGPTGVGKTTTIAKLAAAARLHQGKRVAMVTADTYRVAAVDQLRTYADIMEIPLRVAMTPEEARAAIAHFADHDLILLDTAGRSPSDASRLAELRAILAAARPQRTHLVLAATAAPGVLRRVIDSFAPLGADACIITKLDESPTLGSAISAARSAGVRISHVTNGQEVPDDLAPARSDMLARRILGIDS